MMAALAASLAGSIIQAVRFKRYTASAEELPATDYQNTAELRGATTSRTNVLPAAPDMATTAGTGPAAQAPAKQGYEQSRKTYIGIHAGFIPPVLCGAAGNIGYAAGLMSEQTLNYFLLGFNGGLSVMYPFWAAAAAYSLKTGEHGIKSLQGIAELLTALAATVATGATANNLALGLVATQLIGSLPLAIQTTSNIASLLGKVAGGLWAGASLFDTASTTVAQRPHDDGKSYNQL